MKSLEDFYQSDLLPDLEKLEAQRITVKKKFVQAIFIFIGVNLAFLFVAGRFGLNGIFMFMFLVVSAVFIFFSWNMKHYRGYRAGFKATIIPRIVTFVDQRLQYDKTGMVPKEEFMTSHLFNDKVSEYHGDDLVSGTLGETAIQFSEIHAKRVDIVRKSSSSSSSSDRTKKRVTPIFRGLFFVADFNKSFKGTTIVLPDTAQKLFGDLGQALQSLNVQNGQLVQLEDPEFEKLFVVYGEDQVEARYILSTSLMRRIVDFRNRVQRKMRLSFSASKLYVAIPFERELFEPRVRESLLTISHVQEYFDDLKLVVDLVEELNLNTRIWTRKGETAAGSVAAANAAMASGASNAQSVPPPPPPLQPETRKRYSEKETKALFRDFVNKADTSMAPKIKTAKRWMKRIGGIFLLLLCLPFFLFEAYLAAWIILGFGMFFTAGGFLNPAMEKLVGAIVFTGIGILIALFGYNAYKTGVESTDWPTADGVVIRSEIEQQAVTTEKDGKKKTEVKSYPKIAYQYQVNGQAYESTRISFFSTSGNASQVVSRYPRGKTVRVYYNPDKFKQAVLVPGNTSLNFVPFIFAAVFIMLGLGMATMLRRQTAALGNRA